MFGLFLCSKMAKEVRLSAVGRQKGL